MKVILVRLESNYLLTVSYNNVIINIEKGHIHAP